MKKKKGEKNYNYDTKRFILIFTMMLCLVISMGSYWVFAYNHKKKYNLDNDRIISYRISDYTRTDGNIMYLRNLDENIDKKFVDSQKNIINNNKIIDTDFRVGIYKGILSIKIAYTLYGDLANYEENVILNVDLYNNKEVSNDDMLRLCSSDYKSVATDIYEEYIKLPNTFVGTVTDTIDNSKLTKEEFNNQSEKYIIRIREKLPDVMGTYIYEDEVYYVVRLSDIYKVCYYTNVDTANVNINRKIGKI